MPDSVDRDQRSHRTLFMALGVGAAVGLATVGIIVSIIAIPFFALARFAEPGHGLDEPLIRTALMRVAIPAGVVLGTLTGVAVGRWYRRGGRLPTE
ncbi:MAG: hypothetical protein JWP02_2271 [Acidimicrobiales bacterium]|nr:hypothetical protein [Acidimicrobiales bacterium]